LLVAACVVPSSPIFVTLMKEAPGSSETSVLTRAHGVTTKKTPFFRLLCTLHYCTLYTVHSQTLFTVIYMKSLYITQVYCEGVTPQYPHRYNFQMPLTFCFLPAEPQFQNNSCQQKRLPDDFWALNSYSKLLTQFNRLSPKQTGKFAAIGPSPSVKGMNKNNEENRCQELTYWTLDSGLNSN
jgi:hypothetical protein